MSTNSNSEGKVNHDMMKQMGQIEGYKTNEITKQMLDSAFGSLLEDDQLTVIAAKNCITELLHRNDIGLLIKNQLLQPYLLLGLQHQTKDIIVFTLNMMIVLTNSKQQNVDIDELLLHIDIYNIIIKSIIDDDLSVSSAGNAYSSIFNHLNHHMLTISIILYICILQLKNT